MRDTYTTSSPIIELIITNIGLTGPSTRIVRSLDPSNRRLRAKLSNCPCWADCITVTLAMPREVAAYPLTKGFDWGLRSLLVLRRTIPIPYSHDVQIVVQARGIPSRATESPSNPAQWRQLQRHGVFATHSHLSSDWQFKQSVAVALPAVILKAGGLRGWGA